MEDIHFIYGSDENYISYILVSAASALVGISADVCPVIHLLDMGVEDESWIRFDCELRNLCFRAKIIRHPVRSDVLAGVAPYNGSRAPYVRLFSAEIIADVDWAIYVDGDTLWLGDALELWSLRNDTKLVLGAVDPVDPHYPVNPEFAWYRENGMEVDSDKYVCSGLMLMNLKMMRERHFPDEVREFLTRFPMPRVADQTVLNWAVHGCVSTLPKRWGVFSVWHGGIDLTQSALIHYACDVPWRRTKLNQLFSDIVLVWFDFAKTVLHKDLLREYYGWWTIFWRRALFVILKHFHFLIALNWWVNSRFRNTCGIQKETMTFLHERFVSYGANK